MSDDANLTVPELARKFKSGLMAYLPGLLEDWVALVRASENPKDYQELCAFAARMNGLEPKPDQNSNLPIFNITFTMNGVRAEAKTLDVIDIEPNEVAKDAVPAAIEGQAPQPFVLEIQEAPMRILVLTVLAAAALLAGCATVAPPKALYVVGDGVRESKVELFADAGDCAKEYPDAKRALFTMRQINPEEGYTAGQEFKGCWLRGNGLIGLKFEDGDQRVVPEGVFLGETRPKPPGASQT